MEDLLLDARTLPPEIVSPPDPLETETDHDIDKAFLEMVEDLDVTSILPEQEREMGAGTKPGDPVDPGYFTKDQSDGNIRA